VIQTPLINTWDLKQIPGASTGVTPREKPKKTKGKKKGGNEDTEQEPSGPEVVVFE
jgi:hypothetical protein